LKLEHFQLAIVGFLYPEGSSTPEAETRRRLNICKAAFGGKPAVDIAPASREALLEDVIDRALRPQVPLSAEIGSLLANDRKGSLVDA
jgi:hypothetical protein